MVGRRAAAGKNPPSSGRVGRVAHWERSTRDGEPTLFWSAPCVPHLSSEARRVTIMRWSVGGKIAHSAITRRAGQFLLRSNTRSPGTASSRCLACRARMGASWPRAPSPSTARRRKKQTVRTGPRPRQAHRQQHSRSADGAASPSMRPDIMPMSSEHKSTRPPAPRCARALHAPTIPPNLAEATA
jgi:hypothetical protein